MSAQKPPKSQQRRRRAQSPPQHHSDGVEAITNSLSLTTLSTTERLGTMASRRVLVCSLGNPGRPYASTLHSAGHIVLNQLLLHLPSNTPFAKSRNHGGGLVSSGPVYTLWESPSFMNVSGPSVLAAWKAFLRDSGHNPADMNTKDAGLSLVVLHDELESALGKVGAKPGSGSARGHNGLKSIKQSFPGNLEYRRIGVGIGRPESREPNDVANYVLRKMTGIEKQKIEGSVGGVLAELQKISGSP